MALPLTVLILAGGQSRRMGRDKADIRFAGRSLLDHAISLANRSGAEQIHVLGRPNHPLGVADIKAFEGPARAISGWLECQNVARRILVLPVDMPLLDTPQTTALLAAQVGAYFDDLYLPFAATVAPGFRFDGVRMRELLGALGLACLTVPGEWRLPLTNVNDDAALQALEAAVARAHSSYKIHSGVK